MKHRALATILVGALIIVASVRSQISLADQPGVDNVCTTCLIIRVGLAHVVRGPGADIADNRFAEIQLPGRGFRGFDADGETRAIDGKSPLDMGAPGRVVLKPGPPGHYDSCGEWLNHTELTGVVVLGFVHAGTACNYALGQTHKSMSLATSNDYGLTWRSLGQFITGTDSPTVGKNTGRLLESKWMIR